MAVEQITSLKQLQDRLAALHSWPRPADRVKALALSHEIRRLLKGISKFSNTPEDALAMLADFYRSGQRLSTFPGADGSVASAFGEAAPLFIDCAMRVEDTAQLGALLLDLATDESCWMVEALFFAAGQYLPPEELAKLKHGLKLAMAKSSDEGFRQQVQDNLEILGFGTQDADLLQFVALSQGKEVATWQQLALAGLELQKGNFSAALSAVAQVQTGDWSEQRMLLETRILAHLGNGNESGVVDAASKLLQLDQSVDAVAELLENIGRDLLDRTMDLTLERIHEKVSLELKDLCFLVDVNLIWDLERYVYTHRSELDAKYWDVLEEAAAILGEEAAVGHAVVTRCLLDDILDKSKSHYYDLAAVYLGELVDYSRNVKYWQDLLPQDEYLKQLEERHKRKRAFWAAYAEERKRSAMARRGKR